ncbi:cyclic nucleotide-binding domain-containing protein [Aquihabitans sp. McL0605]|uniref:cyclic nucleotide-binding domain-containing protein n=1 Tax=Aquihabitans sp. McL0605 TaxID=3415671 RepID=UPI003CFAFD70
MFFRTIDPIATRLVDLGLSTTAAARLSTGGTLLDLPAGTTLCTKGERGRQAFLIVEGEATVLTADGTITLGPGEVVGELAALDSKRPRNADVVTATAATVLVFDLGTFRLLASSDDLNPLLAPVRTAPVRAAA